MKLYCFVILVFISVTFTGNEREWGNGGIRGVNSLPIPSTNQNKVISPYSQPPLIKRLLPNKRLQTTTDYQEPKPSASKYPSPYPTNNTNNNENGKAKEQHHDPNYDDNKDTAKKLEEEAQTINRVIVVLGSLGASLLLVAIAIAVLYLKVRRQQKFVKYVNQLSEGGENAVVNTNGDNNNNNKNNNNNNNNNNENGNENGNGIEKGKGDNGGGVGNCEPGINISDGESFEKSNVVDIPNSSSGSNGVDVGVIGNSDKVSNEITEPVHYYHPIQIHNVPQLSPPVQPSAPPAEKVIEDETEETNINSSNLLISTPSLAAPPAYSPTAPPIYALPHIPIPEFDGSIRDMILYTDGNNTYQLAQRQDPHNSEMNNGTLIRMSPLHPSVALPPLNTGVWYAAGPTSQTIPIDYQQSNHSIIIQSINPSSTSTTNLNSSSNSHENNNDDNRPTHQRHNSSTI